LAGKQSTMRDFFLGGRKLPWYAVSGSIIATETSALTFVIVPFIVFNTGPEGNLKYLQLGLFGSIFARIIVGYLLVPAYYEREIYSPYDYMGNRLGNGVRSMTTVLFAVGGMVLTAGGESQRMIVRSYYSDGTNRDVTELATLMSNNDVCARVDASGRVTPGQRGEAQLLARFDVHSVGIPVIVIPADAPTVSPPQPANYIDEFVHKKLVNLRIQPSDVCTDDVFLRRAYIDLTGMLPTPEAHADLVITDSDHTKLARQLARDKELATLIYPETDYAKCREAPFLVFRIHSPKPDFVSPEIASQPAS